MDFKVSSEIKEQVATMTLSGSLDSSSASVFQEEIQKIVGENLDKLVLDLSDLIFMASAGLRMIIFAKQKLGQQVQLFLVKPQGQIVETLKMTGIIHSVHIVDQHPGK